PRGTVQADATVALPLLAAALAVSAPPLLARRKIPVFASMASRVMTIDGETVPTDRFEDVNEPAVRVRSGDAGRVGRRQAENHECRELARRQSRDSPRPYDPSASAVHGDHTSSVR